MLKKVLLALVVIVGGAAAWVASRPSTVRVERSRTLAAPPAIPFGLVNDLHRWRLWSPWESFKPGPKRDFTGPFAGPDARYAWSGPAPAGQGQVTVLESEPYTRIRLQLQLARPRVASATLLFSFQPEGEGVTVRWTWEGQRSFVDKARALFSESNDTVGEELDHGLQALQEQSEAEVRNRQERDALIKSRQAPPAVVPSP